MANDFSYLDEMLYVWWHAPSQLLWFFCLTSNVRLPPILLAHQYGPRIFTRIADDIGPGSGWAPVEMFIGARDSPSGYAESCRAHLQFYVNATPEQREPFLKRLHAKVIRCPSDEEITEAARCSIETAKAVLAQK